MANEIRMITARLVGKKDQAKPKPKQYEFDDPEGGTYPLRVGAFPPRTKSDPAPPEMEIGRTYTFPCEFVPMKDDPTKFYKNFVKENGEYVFQLEEGPDNPTPISQPSPAQKPAYASASGLPREAGKPSQGYWEAKDARDAANQPVIVRESCLKSASRITAAYATEAAKAGRTLSNQALAFETIQMASQFEEWAIHGDKKDKPIEAPV